MPQFDPNALLGVGGIVVGLVGIIMSVFLHFRSKDKKILEYKINSTQLMTEKMTRIRNLKVTIGDQPIYSLVSTTITFFNSGNESILCSDFATKAPLGITITGHLYGNDVSAGNPNSNPSIQTFDEKTYHIVFDFLKPKQSFSISVLHSGKLKILGELKAGKLREQSDLHFHMALKSFMRFLKKHLTFILFFLYILFVLLYFAQKNLKI